MVPDVEHNLFSAKQTDDIAIISFKKNMIRQLTNLSLKEPLFDYLNKTSVDKGIKVVLMFGSPDKIKSEELIEFYYELAKDKSDKYNITRIYNAINQLILMIRGMKKIVIHADSGEILSLFLNVSLACDYRIVGERTVFHFPTLELGLVPKGGGIFFMAKKIGESKTLELLLSRKDITAREAMELKLVDKVVPSETLDEDSIQVAQNFARKPMHLISSTKQLLNFPSGDLAKFLERENELLFGSIRSDKFRDRMDQQS